MRSKSRHRISCAIVILWISVLIPSAHSLSSISPPTVQPSNIVSLAGDWAGAKLALRNPDCCVVSVSGLESHLEVLQEQWSAGGITSDLDLRARVHVRSSAQNDCIQICQSVSPLVGAIREGGDDNNNEEKNDNPCVVALEELARGVASLADGPLEGVCEDVFIRIVCASDYRAKDPMFHTDKAPLRGYVTLRGPGTEFMTRPSTPLEYMRLRSLGTMATAANGGEPANSLRMAQELEFIVMKGDYYEAPSSGANNNASSWLKGLWKRAYACVHRSPPGAPRGERRIIVSLDLADGDDDREWYESNKKREWRSGMTQRKSRLVA